VGEEEEDLGGEKKKKKKRPKRHLGARGVGFSSHPKKINRKDGKEKPGLSTVTEKG